MCSQKSEDEMTDREFSALMEEYRALRAEIIHLMVSRNTILGFYFTGLVLSAGFITSLINSQYLQNYKLFILIVYFSILIPSISLSTFEFWLSESLRGHKVALYIHATMEERLKIMKWEGLNITEDAKDAEQKVSLSLPKVSEGWKKLNKHIKDVEGIMNLIFQISAISILLSWIIFVVFEKTSLGKTEEFYYNYILVAIIFVLIFILIFISFELFSPTPLNIGQEILDYIKKIPKALSIIEYARERALKLIEKLYKRREKLYKIVTGILILGFVLLYAVFEKTSLEKIGVLDCIYAVTLVSLSVLWFRRACELKERYRYFKGMI